MRERLIEFLNALDAAMCQPPERHAYIMATRDANLAVGIPDRTGLFHFVYLDEGDLVEKPTDQIVRECLAFVVAQN